MHFPKDTPNEADLSKIAITHPVDADVTVGYFDSDIITIDNVKLLTDPTTARLQMNVVAFCNQGKMQASMNGQPIVLRANQLLICPSQVSFTDFMFSPDFAFKAIDMTVEYVEEEQKPINEKKLREEAKKAQKEHKNNQKHNFLLIILV